MRLFEKEQKCNVISINHHGENRSGVAGGSYWPIVNIPCLDLKENQLSHGCVIALSNVHAVPEYRAGLRWSGSKCGWLARHGDGCVCDQAL